jgi:hypothetical protein
VAKSTNRQQEKAANISSQINSAVKIMNMSPNASSQSNSSKSDPMTDFLSREQAAMEAMEGENSAAQEHDDYSIIPSSSLPFPPSPIKSEESSVSDRPAPVMDAAQIRAVAEWREEFEKACAYRIQRDNEKKLELAKQAAKDATDWKKRHEEEIQGNKERNRINAQNAQQGTWLKSLDGKPLDVNVLEEIALPGNPAAERVLKTLLIAHGVN